MIRLGIEWYFIGGKVGLGKVFLKLGFEGRI